MVKLTPEQQEEELQDIKYFLKGFEDLQVVELQVQQVKRLIYFAQKGLQFHRQNRIAARVADGDGAIG